MSSGITRVQCTVHVQWYYKGECKVHVQYSGVCVCVTGVKGQTQLRSLSGACQWESGQVPG